VIDATYLEHCDGDPTAAMRILVSVDGEDARRLERIAKAKDKTPHEVVAELLRAADQPRP
jgi:hypothetical protein